MGKKIEKPKTPKKKLPQTDTTCLTPGQYWEFRTTIVETDLAASYLEIAKLKYKIGELELEKIGQIVNEKKQKLHNSRQEYTHFLQKLEKQVGQNIKGKIIDPFTYRVKDDEGEI